MSKPSKLPIPFWAVTPHHLESPPPNEPCDERLHTLAFSEIGLFMQFLSRGILASGEIRHNEQHGPDVAGRRPSPAERGPVSLTPKADGRGGKRKKLGIAPGRVKRAGGVSQKPTTRPFPPQAHSPTPKQGAGFILPKPYRTDGPSADSPTPKRRWPNKPRKDHPPSNPKKAVPTYFPSETLLRADCGLAH